MTNASFRRDELLNPAGLMKQWQGPSGVAFRESIALTADNLMVAAELVGDARNPLKCDATVLPYHGRDRGIRRYATESESSYRKRLAKWKQIWQSAGRAWGILRQLRILLLPYGRPTIKHVVSSGDGSFAQWSELAPGDGTRDYFEVGGLDPEYSSSWVMPSNWLWDPDAVAGAWSRFSIIIAMDGITSPDVSAGEWDGASDWDGTNVWDGGLSNPVVQDIVALCNDWKAAHAQLLSVLFVPTATTLQSGGLAATVMPWGYSTYPDQNWNDLAKRNPEVIYAYVR